MIESPSRTKTSLTVNSPGSSQTPATVDRASGDLLTKLCAFLHTTEIRDTSLQFRRTSSSATGNGEVLAPILKLSARDKVRRYGSTGPTKSPPRRWANLGPTRPCGANGSTRQETSSSIQAPPGLYQLDGKPPSAFVLALALSRKERPVGSPPRSSATASTQRCGAS
jgi:hypothetical protein